MKRFTRHVPIVKDSAELLALVDKCITRGELERAQPKEETPPDGDQTPQR